jgi:hypothetical protein
MIITAIIGSNRIFEIADKLYRFESCKTHYDLLENGK